MTVKIYLAGPINGKSDDECTLWREDAKSAIESTGHTAVDPMARDYRGAEGKFFDEIVLSDKRDIDSCDAILVNANEPSWGTAMEIMHGYFHRKTIASFCESGSVSPWLMFHSTAIFCGLGDAVSWLTLSDKLEV